MDCGFPCGKPMSFCYAETHECRLFREFVPCTNSMRSLCEREGLQKKCKSLYAYCSYVNRVKQNLKAKQPLRKAVEEALDYAIAENLLDGYFKQQKMEVLNMSLTEFDQEQYDRNRRREGIDEGFLLGKQEDARNALALGIPIDQVAKITGLAVEDIRALEAAPVTV